MLMILQIVTLAIVMISNIILIIFLYKAKKTQSELDTQLISDLMSKGRTLIEIKRVAPEQFFIRRS